MSKRQFPFKEKKMILQKLLIKKLTVNKPYTKAVLLYGFSVGIWSSVASLIPQRIGVDGVL